jgi:hypothetical protein
MAGTIATTIPSVFYEFAFNADPNQNTLPPYWQDLSSRVQFPWDASPGGRQYELNVNETGLAHLMLANPDGALDPGNPASVFAPGVKLYRPCRIRVPFAPTRNLLPQVVATGSAAMNAVTDSVANWWYQNRAGGTLAQAVNLAAAPSGQTSALAWSTPSGTTTASSLLAGVNPGNANGPVMDNVQVTAGLAYTASVYLSRTASADATVQLTPNIIWFDASGTLIPSATGSAVTVPTSGWVRATVTKTAPATAVWGRMSLFISSPSPTTAANTVYATGWQVEQAAAATAWVDPGITRFIFTGGVERWTQTWTEQNGTYGTVLPIGVDAAAGLALPTLQSPLVNEVLAMSPTFFYQLNEPAGSAVCADSAGNRVAAPVETSPFGAGSLVFGGTVTSTNPGSAFVGTPGPVATFANNPNSALPGQYAETYVALHKTTAAPGPPTAGSWTRLVAFRASVIPGGSNFYTLWSANPPSWYTNPSTMDISITVTGALSAVFVDSSSGTLGYATPGSLCDGNWHLVGIGNTPGGSGTIWVDGAVVATSAGVGSGTGFASDTLGCDIRLGKSFYDSGHVGDLAFAMEFPALLTTAQVLNLYNSWRTASSGESSDARYRRVLTWVGYAGPTAIDAGATRSMGPATDLTGATALDALNLVALTEAGDSYMSPAGVATFKARTARYNQRTPVFVFGEGLPVGAAGEWPCEIVGIDYDPSHLANTVQVQQYNGVTGQALDAASKRSYYSRTYQRTINVTSAAEAADAATYLLGQLKDPHPRTEVMRLHPSAVPGLFAVCVQLEKGQRIQQIRRPNGAPSITVDGFVEKVSWGWDPFTGDVWVDVQASPADLANYWVLGALHTTLNLQAAAGQNKATINALQDAAVNKLAQSLPSGYQLTFEPGTARAETLTLAAGGIPATSLGYTSAQLTFTTNMAFTHAINSTVCEPLPAGYTDPTVWDASSLLGATSTTVLSGGGSGTNTVTVGPLPDAKVNPLGTTWNTNDVIWLSPGTARFEAATILSVAPTFPGYTSCVITLAANLTNSHNPADTVCDVLPAGVTNPAAVLATTRVSY